jgi:hypothetical protein
MNVFAAAWIALPLWLIWASLPSGYALLSVLREIRDHLKDIREQGQPWNRK